ncbi:hypothetical protein ACIHFD_49065 [Nonomuraea sp. NPDC051941]|uniref:hypothetical protein n=1 Tax=Nonomuraea sp. NPDC051941 TaxID=3364373 RepID=UPI0037C8EE7B
MSERGVTTNLPVSLYYDGAKMTEQEAIAELYKMLREAERAGHFNRLGVAFGEDFDPEPFTPTGAESDEDGDDSDAVEDDDEDGADTGRLESGSAA